MLKLMRKAIKPDGRLMFTAFLNETSSTGHGYIDAWIKNLSPEESDKLRNAPDEEKAPFTDAIPDDPLLVAIFRRDYAIELAREAGWEVIDVRDPLPFVQHQLICRPI